MLLLVVGLGFAIDPEEGPPDPVPAETVPAEVVPAEAVPAEAVPAEPEVPPAPAPAAPAPAAPAPTPPAPPPSAATPFVLPPPEPADPAPRADDPYAAGLKLQRKATGYALGGGLYSLPDHTVPMVQIELLRKRPLTESLAFNRDGSIEIHDFEAIGAVYDWYGKVGPDDEDLRVIKYVALFPGLFLAPLAGSNLRKSYLLDLAVPVGPTVLHLAGGVHAGLVLRPSEPGIRFDLSVGLVSTVRLDVSPRVSLTSHARWAPPFVHSLTDPDWLDTYSFGLGLVWWSAERRTSIWSRISGALQKQDP